MTEDIFPMTKTGLKKIKLELEQLNSVKREHAKQRIKHARGFCDFAEDSEYEMALKELARIEERVSSLKYKIQQAEIIEKTETSQVGLGSTVSFKRISNGEIETYTIVGTVEADPFEDKISNNSPIAKALLDSKVNDEVTVKTPNGNRRVKIVSIS